MFKSGYIAILGAPNSGKSTLLNKILDNKIAAVTFRPQTTRKRLKGIHTSQSAQMIFLDTPGIHIINRELNRFMRHEVESAVREADILCYLIGLDRPLSPLLLEMSDATHTKYPEKRRLVALNKIDLGMKERQLNARQVKKSFPECPLVPLSARTGKGVDQLVKSIEKALPEGPQYYPADEQGGISITDASLREIAAEIVREKIMELTFEEIPYSVAIEVQSFKETAEITRISMTVVVEHESQKGMVIGKGGRMMKEIGTRGRKDIEALLGGRVFLELRVKVDKNWTKNAAKMARYGYSPSFHKI